MQVRELALAFGPSRLLARFWQDGEQNRVAADTLRPFCHFGIVLAQPGAVQRRAGRLGADLGDQGDGFPTFTIPTLASVRAAAQAKALEFLLTTGAGDLEPAVVRFIAIGSRRKTPALLREKHAVRIVIHLTFPGIFGGYAH
jgi:hypothetical protein